MELEAITQGHGCRIAAAGPLLVVAFNQAAGPELLGILDTAQQRHVDKHGKISTLTVITQEKLEAPTSEFRARAAALRAKFSSRTVSSAMVILTRGLAAVIVRTFLAGYQLLIRHEYPEASFRDITSAVKWLQGLESQLPAIKQMQGLVEAVEAFAQKKP